MRIFDVHLHLFTRGVFGFYARQSPELAAAPDPALAAVQKLGIEAPPPEPEALAARWISEMDRHGVDRAALLGSAPGEQEAVAKAVRSAPSRFVGYQMVHPKSPGVVHDEMRGVLMFPALHGYFPDDPSCRPIYETARKRGLVVFVHLGRLRIAIREKLGIPGSIDERFGSADTLLSVAREFPDVRFQIPHFGCGTLATLRTSGLRNLYLDTSSSNDWMKQTPEFPDLKSVFRAAVDAFGADRLLFGSDSTVFPRAWRKDVLEAQLAATRDFSDSDREKIFGDNARRLLA